jgi:hypothetical protein
VTAGNYLIRHAFFNSNRPYYAGGIFYSPLLFLSGIFLLFFLFGAEPDRFENPSAIAHPQVIELTIILISITLFTSCGHRLVEGGIQLD